MDKFEDIRDAIDYECIDVGSLTYAQVKVLYKFMKLAKNAYILVEWPDSQEYMEEDWFQDEAILSENSSYFIPLRRLL